MIDQTCWALRAWFFIEAVVQLLSRKESAHALSDDNANAVENVLPYFQLGNYEVLAIRYLKTL